MRISCILAFIAVILFGCSKNNDRPQSPDTTTGDYTPIPGSEPVSANIYGFVLDDENHTLQSSAVADYNYNSYPLLQNGTFITGITSVDKYTAKFRIQESSSDHFATYKTFPITTSIINYVNFKLTKRRNVGGVSNVTGSTNLFANGGSISMGVNALYETGSGIYPGVFSTTLTGDMFATYLDPTAEDFVSRLPCYPMGDDEQKRWFLKSYGVVNLKVQSSSLANMDLYNSATATLKLPIPATMLATAPDSVEKWVLRNAVWEKAGFAKKVNNFYVATINTFSTWNFASKTNAVYRTFKLRTDSGAAVINATVRIKSNNVVVAESQTDADGNAICFVPSSSELRAELLSTWNRFNYSVNTPLFSTVIPSANTASAVDVILNSTLQGLFTLRGNATNCDGSPIQNGMINFTNLIFPKEHYFPVINGIYNSAIFYETGPYEAKIKVKNSGNNVQGIDTGIAIYSGTVNKNNLNTCAASTDLFINYTVDNTAYSITGDMSHPSSPVLDVNYDGSANTTMISTDDFGAKEFQFETHGGGVGTLTGSGIYSLFINGTFYFYDPGRPMSVTFTRYDILLNGFVIGSADFYYLDNNNVDHHVVTNFKLRRAM